MTVGRAPARRRFAALGLLATAALAAGDGCGPERKPPEADVSAVPAPILEAFRRDQPNSVVLRARPDDDGEWRIDMWTPRGEHKSAWYSRDGDKVRGW